MAEYLCEEDMSTGEYISRDLALRQLNATCSATSCDNYNGVRCRACAYADAMDFIEAIPAADVQPVKHGYWIKQPEKFQIHEDVINSNYLYSCSCCNASDLHSERANNDGEVKFCWRCGARMDGDTE
jgi:hypothetical protein